MNPTDEPPRRSSRNDRSRWSWVAIVLVGVLLGVVATGVLLVLAARFAMGMW